MKKNKNKVDLPIGKKIWFYNEETERIESDYLWGVIYSKTPPNASREANEIYVSEYVIGKYADQRLVLRSLCFFTWKEVLNFVASECELPLKGDNQ